ncbi:UNVERIFIED_CONTAM: tetrahydrofolate dehydrogenase/cyclohydrolase, NAD(P)-binding domain-containing protein [Hammondia hammondi]|eukprot:XP_008883224.1 tetrahydrofolate dehydrogenase/cyclohydrolase, NAD(P)-binding domain-containing protein [Hammondia hammondi]
METTQGEKLQATDTSLPAAEGSRRQPEPPDDCQIPSCREIAQNILEKVHRGVLALRELGEQCAFAHSSSLSSSSASSSSAFDLPSLASCGSAPPSASCASSGATCKAAEVGVRAAFTGGGSEDEEGRGDRPEGSCSKASEEGACPGSSEEGLVREERVWRAFLERARAPPQLVAVAVGTEDAGASFLRSQKRAAAASGVCLSLLEFGGSVSLGELREQLRCLDASPEVDGVIMLSPFGRTSPVASPSPSVASAAFSSKGFSCSSSSSLSSPSSSSSPSPSLPGPSSASFGASPLYDSCSCGSRDDESEVEDPQTVFSQALLAPCPQKDIDCMHPENYGAMAMFRIKRAHDSAEQRPETAPAGEGDSRETSCRLASAGSFSFSSSLRGERDSGAGGGEAERAAEAEETDSGDRDARETDTGEAIEEREQGEEREEGAGRKNGVLLPETEAESGSGRKGRNPEDVQTESERRTRKRKSLREERREMKRHLRRILRDLEEETADRLLPFPAPCVALAVLDILKAWGISLVGATVAVVGASPRVGQAIALLLLQHQATVSLCHSRTRTLKEILMRSDIIIAAAGFPHLISSDMVCPNAAVIDVGVNASERSIEKNTSFVSETDTGECFRQDAGSLQVREGSRGAGEDRREKRPRAECRERDSVAREEQRGPGEGKRVGFTKEMERERAGNEEMTQKKGGPRERQELEKEQRETSLGGKPQFGPRVKVVGDVDLDVKKNTKFITPVPQGVGLVTSAVLMRQVLKAKVLQLLRSLPKH